MSSVLNQKFINTNDLKWSEKLMESILGDEGWEKINTIGWTVVLMGWIMAYYFIGAWSFMIIAIFAIFIREISISRKAMITKYYKYNYFKIRVWEDDQFNYEVKVAFSMMEVYPLIFRDNIIKARVYINTKNHTKLVEYARSKLNMKKESVQKIKDLEEKIAKLQKAKEDKDLELLKSQNADDKTQKLPSPNVEQEDPEKTIKGESPSNPQPLVEELDNEEDNKNTDEQEDNNVDDEEEDEDEREQN
jgi:hypothetical protein